MFGPKGFTVSQDKIITFDEFQLDSSLEVEKQDNPGSKPSTYIKNPGLDSFNMKVKLDSDFGVHPLNQIEDWMKVKDAKNAYPFLIKGKPLLNTKWLLVSVQLSDTQYDRLGNLMRATLALKFDEFVKAGSKKESSSSSSGGGSRGSGSSSSGSGYIKPLAPTTTTIIQPINPKDKIMLGNGGNTARFDGKPSMEIM